MLGRGDDIMSRFLEFWLGLIITLGALYIATNLDKWMDPRRRG